MYEHPRPSNVSRMLGIDDDATDAMRLGWLVLEPRVPDLVEGFYRHPVMALQFAGVPAETRARVMRAQEEHWHSLFLSRFDRDYEVRVRRAAIAHRRIGMPLSNYVLAYFVMADIIGRNIAELFAHAPDVLARIQFALPKYIAFDVVLTMRVYDAVELDA